MSFTGTKTIWQMPSAKSRQAYISKSQTVSGELVLLGKRPDSVWRINLFTPETRFNPVEFDGIGISETASLKLAPTTHKELRLKLMDWAEEQEAGR